MKTLRQIIDEAGDKARVNVIKPDFKAYINTNEVVVQAILERTAVVYPINYVHQKFLANLAAVIVDEKDIEWYSKTEDQLRILRARSNGQDKTTKRRLVLSPAHRPLNNKEQDAEIAV